MSYESAFFELKNPQYDRLLAEVQVLAALEDATARIAAANIASVLAELHGVPFAKWWESQIGQPRPEGSRTECCQCGQDITGTDHRGKCPGWRD